MNYGAEGRNDPQLWLVGFDESSIGDKAYVTVDKEGLTGWTSKDIVIGATNSSQPNVSTGFFTLELDEVWTNKGKIILFNNDSGKPENGTYHLTITGGGLNLSYTITVNLN